MSQVTRKEKDTRTCGQCYWNNLCGEKAMHKACQHYREKEKKEEKTNDRVNHD